jgi:hypothetical protein
MLLDYFFQRGTPNSNHITGGTYRRSNLRALQSPITASSLIVVEQGVNERLNLAPGPRPGCACSEEPRIFGRACGGSASPGQKARAKLTAVIREPRRRGHRHVFGLSPLKSPALIFLAS